MVISRFLFCLIIADIVVFSIRFQILVSVISMEESSPFADPLLPHNRNKHLWFRNLSANPGRQNTGNRKLVGKAHVLKISLGVKEKNDNDFKVQICFSRFLLIFHQKWSFSDGTRLSVVALLRQSTASCTRERLIMMKRNQGVITRSKHQTE